MISKELIYESLKTEAQQTNLVLNQELINNIAEVDDYFGLEVFSVTKNHHLFDKKFNLITPKIGYLKRHVGLKYVGDLISYFIIKHLGHFSQSEMTMVAQEIYKLNEFTIYDLKFMFELGIKGQLVNIWNNIKLSDITGNNGWISIYNSKMRKYRKLIEYRIMTLRFSQLL